MTSHWTALLLVTLAGPLAAQDDSIQEEGSQVEAPQPASEVPS